jgi:hypothetical protein
MTPPQECFKSDNVPGLDIYLRLIVEFKFFGVQRSLQIVGRNVWFTSLDAARTSVGHANSSFLSQDQGRLRIDRVSPRTSFATILFG